MIGTRMVSPASHGHVDIAIKIPKVIGRRAAAGRMMQSMSTDVAVHSELPQEFNGK